MWISIFLILLATLALAFIGLWSAKNAEHEQDINYEKALYQAKVAEIEVDFELGRIDQNARDAAKAESARTLLKYTQSDNGYGALAPSKTFVLIIIAMVFIPASSLAIYGNIGSPEIGNSASPGSVTERQPTLQDLLQAAESRLSENPDDLRGWQAVAPVYMRFGEFEKAVGAFRNILRLDGENPEVTLALAEALVFQHENEIRDEAFEIFQQLKIQQPDNDRAIYFVALGEFQRGNAVKAEGIWQGMLEKSDGTEPWLPVVRSHLEELANPSQSQPTFSADQLEQVNQMVSGLAQRLEEEPDDKEGWERLVQSYMVLDRGSEALKAVERAKSHFEHDRQFIAKLEGMVTELSQ